MELEPEGRRDFSMILIRVMVGLVFLLEGSLKLLRPEELGGGAVILLNIYAGDAALALLVVIVTALVTTKIPILLGRPLGPFPLEKLKEYGLLSFFHQARTDFCMVLGLLAILIDSGLKVGKKRRWYQTGPN